MTNPHTLTAKDVLTLRASVRWRGQVDLTGSAAALIFWDAAAKRFSLAAYGRIMAQSESADLLGRLLIQERAQPGRIAALLDTATDPETAALDDPSARQDRQQAIRAAQALTARNTTTDAANRRLQALRPTSVSLDDLLEDS